MTISSAEWEVLRVIWTKEEATSSQIIKVLSSKKNWSVSTIKTLIGRLVDKGVLQSHREGRGFIYHTNLSEEETNLTSIRHELDKICQTKHAALIAQLLTETPMTKDDVESLRAVLTNKKTVASVECHCVPGQCNCHKPAD
ncbi:CopY/TcrY family copper transport repressor [Streptococcus dentapri]|uniref:CopY/TcrY family copper transport repressor n=1 Tax=Streptococcus dentapri TaxID=573564 RepID=A0ABV8D398_9STRE